MTEPPDDVRREFEAILEQDDSRVGQVYRLTNKGLSPPQIASELGVSTSGFVFNARSMARGLLDGHVPTGPALAGQVLSFVQRVSKSAGLSTAAREYLDQQVDLLSEAAGRPRHRGGGAPPTARRSGSSARESTRSPSLRSAVEDELRVRVRRLARQIKESTSIDPSDYWSVTTSSGPLDVVVRLVRTPGEQGTFKRLVDLGRIDLTLEAAVVAWAGDLPLQRDLVEDAEAKKDWFS